ncbi:MAG TPA: NAD(P)-dependent oxidoreductase, partial [Kofleriaceae bacterium]
GATAISGDMRDDASWRIAAASAEAIIHAGQLRFGRLGGRAHDALVQADRRALDLLLAAARPDLRVLVYTSGFLVYGACLDGPVSEARAVAPYPAVAYKREHEQLALASGKPVVVVRPSTVYGTRGIFARYSLAPTLKGGPARHPGDGNNATSYVHTDDLAEAFRRCLEDPRPGEIFNVTDDQPTTPRSMLSELARQAGARPPRSLPAWLFKLAAGRLAPALLAPTQITSDKIKAALGWSPQYPTIREGVAAVIAATR